MWQKMRSVRGWIEKSLQWQASTHGLKYLIGCLVGAHPPCAPGSWTGTGACPYQIYGQNYAHLY